MINWNEVKRGQFIVVESGVSCGDGCEFAHFSCIMRGTTMGNNCYIGQFVRTGYDCILGNNVDVKMGTVIGPNVIIGNDVFIGPNVNILHGKPGGISLQTVIGSNVYIGAGSVIGAGVSIGDNVTIGANSVVLHDCIEPGLYIGAPAIIRRRTT